MERQTRLHGVDAEQQSRPHTDHGEQQSIKRKAALMSGGASASASAAPAPTITVEDAMRQATLSLQQPSDTLFFREDQCDVIGSSTRKAIRLGKGGHLHLSGERGSGKKTALDITLKTLEAEEEKRVAAMPDKQKERRFDVIRMSNDWGFDLWRTLAVQLVAKKLIPAFDGPTLSLHGRRPLFRMRDVEKRLLSAQEQNYPLTVLVIYGIDHFSIDFVKAIVGIANSAGGKLLLISTANPKYSFFDTSRADAISFCTTVHFPKYSLQELMVICKHYSKGVIHEKGIRVIFYQLAVIKGTCFWIICDCPR
jgi:hypothetical protein